MIQYTVNDIKFNVHIKIESMKTFPRLEMAEHGILVTVSSQKEGHEIKKVQRKLQLRVPQHCYKGNFNIYKELAKAICVANGDSYNFIEFHKHIQEDINYMSDKQLNSYFNHLTGLKTLRLLFKVSDGYNLSARLSSMAFTTNFNDWYTESCIREGVIIKSA